ncbi:hypothetical protein OOU_Y34scaffold01039g4 [Pyricularia oryzae Y34]|uniref:Uncharacterized protein n=1 Tax=Pyricularia oryzae (strain Y34) TaxID=1143189 RepID=A0AA97PFM8_PYRO3|nr:hypothetical protein OOU_Y34scaffold01039g4 [Pyricularia oryzae Y34]
MATDSLETLKQLDMSAGGCILKEVYEVQFFEVKTGVIACVDSLVQLLRKGRGCLYELYLLEAAQVVKKKYDSRCKRRYQPPIQAERKICFFESLGQYPGQIPAPTIPVEAAENHVPLVHADAELQGILRGSLETAINEEVGKLGGLLQCLLRDLVVAEINQQFKSFTRMVGVVIREIKNLISEELNKMKTGMESFMQAAGDQFGLHPEEVD